MFRKLILASAVSLALAPFGAEALGLGALHTESGLNQPFVAEIDLIGAKSDELDTVKAVLASEAEFAKVGAERHFFLTKLQFNSQISPQGRPVLRVTSREPIREPFVDFLVELNWPTGRLVREYTVLLDPPVTRDRQSVPVVSAPVAARPVARASEPQSAPRSPRESQRTGPGRPPVTSSSAAFPLRSAPVASGASLLQVARRLAAPGATVAQAALALYRNNQDAFIAGDINRIRAGQTLTIPSAAELFALDADAAKRELTAAMRGQPVTRRPLQAGGQMAEPNAAAEGARLRIAGTAPPAAPKAVAPAAPPIPARSDEVKVAGDLEQELLLVRETGESTRQETEELRGRIRQLEAQLADIQSLLVLRNGQLAQLQLDQAVAAEQQGAATATPPPVASLDKILPQPKDGVASPADPAPQGGVQLPAGKIAPLPSPAPPDTGDKQPPGEAQAPQGSAPQAEPIAEPPAVPAAPVEPSPPARIATSDAQPRPTVPTAAAEPKAPASEPDSGLWSLMRLGAGVLALIGVAALYLIRRQRRLAASLHLDDELTIPAGPDGGPAGPDQVLSPDRLEAAGNDGLLQAGPPITSSFAHAAPLPFLEESEVDIFSEADIYIAYGRYREAEALLREEVSRYPERIDLKFKLAEALFGMKRYDAFATLLDQLQSAGADRTSPDHWRRLSAMQASLQQEAAPVGGAVAAGPMSWVVTPDLAKAPIPDAPMAATAERVPAVPGPTDQAPRPRIPGAAADLPDPAPVPVSDTPSLLDLDLDLDALTSSVAGRTTTGGLAQEDPAALLASNQTAVSARDSRAVSDLEIDLRDYPSLTASDWEGLEIDGAQPMRAGASGERAFPRLDVDDDYLAVDADSGSMALDLDLGDLLVPGDTSTSSDLQSMPWQPVSDLWDEVATKLDLARAYLDMKDNEAARTILEEVAEEGNDAQRVEARQLLERLR